MATKKRALEQDDTSVRRKHGRGDSVVVDLDLEPDIPSSQEMARPLDKAILLELHGERLGVLKLILGLRDNLPPEASVTDLTECSFGYRVRTRFPDAVTEAAGKLGFEVGPPPRPSRFVNVRVEGVPRAVSEEELLEDLQRHLRTPRYARSVRRLFASTEGRVDRDRPLPVVFVTVAVAVFERLQSWRLYGACELRVSSRPQHEVETPQCPRCLDWGHRAGSCRNPRRCAVCGKADHLALDCSKREETPRCCFQCGGAHSSRYRGCKARRIEEERIRVLSAGPSFDHPAAVAVATGSAPPPLSYSSAVTGARPALEVSSFPPLEQQPLPAPLPPAELLLPLPESRTETSRARAELLLQHTQALESLNSHLARLQHERTTRPARALTRVVSRFRRQRDHHRQRLAVLNRERILADAVSPSPWRGRPLNVTFVTRMTSTEDLVAAPEPAKAVTRPATHSVATSTEPLPEPMSVGYSKKKTVPKSVAVPVPKSVANASTSTESLPEPMSVAFSDEPVPVASLVPVPVASLVPVPVANLVPVPVANASTSTEPQPVASTSSAQAASTSVDEALATILSALRLRPSTASIAPVVEQLVFRALLSGVDPDEVDDLTLDDLSDSELEELARIYRN